MADFQAPKWPDSYQNHIDRPAIIRTAENLWVWPQMWKVVYDTKNWVATIFVKWEAKKEASELSEDLKKWFIEKLKKQTKNQDILDAIKNWTLEIYKTPSIKWKELSFDVNWYAKNKETPWVIRFAISLKWDNVDYIYNTDWTEYFDYKWRRDDPIRYSAFRWFTWIEEKNINGVNYIIKDWKQYKVFSKEYYEVLLNEIWRISEFWKILMEMKFEK